MILKYFVYDTVNDINTKKVSIEEFEYNKSTLVWDLYRELLKTYVNIRYNDLDNIDDIGQLICGFNIIDTVNRIEISEFNGTSNLSEVISNVKDKILCIIPLLPIGATVAEYNKKYKVIIHSQEDNHQRFPHVHVCSKDGLSCVVNLNNLEIVEGVELTGKPRKIIWQYLENNKDFLIETYNMILKHKDTGKIEIEILR